MIMIILAIAAFVIFNIYQIKEWGWEWSSFLFSFVIGIGGFLVGMLIALLASSIFLCQPIEDCKIVEKDQIELVALKDGFQMEGSAFLFSAVVNEELRYTYIYETEMGKTTASLDADSCYIKYVDEDIHPYIQKWEVRPYSDFIYYVFCPGYYKYTIYLPQGSVIENVYEIDLE